MYGRAASASDHCTGPSSPNRGGAQALGGNQPGGQPRVESSGQPGTEPSCQSSGEPGRESSGEPSR